MPPIADFSSGLGHDSQEKSRGVEAPLEAFRDRRRGSLTVARHQRVALTSVEVESRRDSARFHIGLLHISKVHYDLLFRSMLATISTHRAILFRENKSVPI